MLKRKKIFIILMVVLIPTIVTGCVFNSSKTSIKGTVTIDGEPMSGVKILAGSNMAMTDNNGNYMLVVEPGTYDVNVKTMFVDSIKKNVSVKKGESTSVSKSFNFSDLNISDSLFLKEDEYYRPYVQKEDGSRGLWENTTIFKIMHGVGGRWKYGEITYSITDKASTEQKNTIRNMYEEISDQLNNVVTFKEVNTSGDINFIEKSLFGKKSYTKVKWSAGYIYNVEVAIDPDNWKKHILYHEMMHSVGLVGDAHLPQYNKEENYDGTGKIMYYEKGFTDKYSQEVWNSLKLKYSINPGLDSNPTWANLDKIKSSGTIIEY